jgi:putative transposase
VGDDNAFAEALFRTAKYRPEFPLRGFADLDAARQWAMRFVHWYKHEHRHSGIRYVTPGQRHAGQDRRVLTARHALYQDARERNPRRWSGSTRNWTSVTVVTLNPERDIRIQAATSPIPPFSSIGEPAFPSRPGSAQASVYSVSAAATDPGSRWTSCGRPRPNIRTLANASYPDLHTATAIITRRRYIIFIAGD